MSETVGQVQLVASEAGSGDDIYEVMWHDHKRERHISVQVKVSRYGRRPDMEAIVRARDVVREMMLVTPELGSLGRA